MNNNFVVITEERKIPILESENPCPFCGGKKWLCFDKIDNFYDNYKSYPALIDIYINFHTVFDMADECLKCGAVLT